MISQLDLRYVNRMISEVGSATEFACGLPEIWVTYDISAYEGSDFQPEESLPYSFFAMFPELNAYNDVIMRHFGSEINYLRYLIASLEMFR